MKMKICFSFILNVKIYLRKVLTKYFFYTVIKIIFLNLFFKTIINKKLKLMVILLSSKTQFTIHFNSVIIVMSLGHFLFYLRIRG
jgi:hypothetical protein